MTSMKEQTFGIELEMNGILRTKAAKVIAEHFGTTPSMPDHTCYHTQTVRMTDGRVWKVMRDGSIPGPDDEKTEVVSPICRWEDIETVQELVRKLRRAGAKADPAHGSSAGRARKPTRHTAASTSTSGSANTPPRP